MNILFLPKWYPSKFDGLDGNFIENHARAVAKYCDLAVLFVHSDSEVSKGLHFESKQNDNFIELRVFYSKPNFSFNILNLISSFYRHYKAQRAGYKKLLEHFKKFDLLHLHINGRNASLALKLFYQKKMPYILSEHSSVFTKESQNFRGMHRKLLYPIVTKNAKKVTVVSNYLKQAMINHGLTGKYEIIPNTIDIGTFSPNEKSNNSVKRIIHISNLSRIPKNMHLIIEALDEVGKIREDFEFILIGGGKDEKEMLRKLKQSSIKNRFYFLGELDNQEVAKELSKADFLLLYSSFETQSLVMLEAFACGVPVVVPQVGGIPEYMDSKRGLLLEPNDKSQLINGINEMLDHSEQYDKQQLRKFAVDHFSEDVVGKQFIQLYQNTLGIE